MWHSSTSLIECIPSPIADTIQDFRSEEGLYSLIKAQQDNASSKPKPFKGLKGFHPTALAAPTSTKGKDLFDSMIWKNPNSTSTFYRFIASLRKSIHEDVKKTSATHRFIRTLRECKKLVRCYTQNIDGLEEIEGMCTELDRGKGSRSRFSKKAMTSPKAEFRIQPGGPMDMGCEVVQLHGDLKSLRCTLCHQRCEWDTGSHNSRFLAGKAPLCQHCLTTDSIRQAQGKRGTKVGILRPNIVLYGEEHPSADAIGSITSNDLTMSPDLLLILGTSLHVHGLKTLVREFAKSVHARPGGRGKVVFINLSRPAESVWKDVIDYWVCMDCDGWVSTMRKCRPDIWQVQEELRLRIKKTPLKPLKGKVHEEDQEKIIPDSDTSSPSSLPRPKVVITTPKKHKQPLKEQNYHSGITMKYRKSPPSMRMIPDSDLRSSLPTPPSSGGEEGSTKKRKTLTDIHNEGNFVTPSKRRKLDIWED